MIHKSLKWVWFQAQELEFVSALISSIYVLKGDYNETKKKGFTRLIFGRAGIFYTSYEDDPKNEDNLKMKTTLIMDNYNF